MPLGALIAVFVAETSSNALPSAGSTADAGGNTYSYQIGQSHNNVQTNGFSAIHTAPVTTALTSAQLITYTKATSGVATRLVTGYVTGQDTTTPVDTAACAAAFGTGLNPSVTSGTPSRSGPFFLGVAAGGSAGTPTQAASPPWTGITINAATVALYSAWQQGVGTATATYNPTNSTSRAWSALILVVNPPAAGGNTLSIALQEAGDTFAATLQLRVQIAAALAEAGDSFAASLSGSNRILAALQESGDVAALSLRELVAIAAAIQENGDVFFADIQSGSGPPPVTGGIIPVFTRRRGRR